MLLSALSSGCCKEAAASTCCLLDVKVVNGSSVSSFQQHCLGVSTYYQGVWLAFEARWAKIWGVVQARGRVCLFDVTIIWEGTFWQERDQCGRAGVVRACTHMVTPCADLHMRIGHGVANVVVQAYCGWAVLEWFVLGHVCECLL